jgi:predicted ArsR family transcriptional regulator
LLRRGAALQRKAARLVGRPEQLLLRELLDRGQASASDEDLQRSLGLSRARLSQLLTNLLEHDLVEADTLRTEGPGRPKTVYRPRLEDDPADEGSRA